MENKGTRNDWKLELELKREVIGCVLRYQRL